MHGKGSTGMKGVQGTINPSDFGGEPGCESGRTSSTLSSMSNLQEMADALECALGKDPITQLFLLAPHCYFDYTTRSSLDSGERSALLICGKMTL